MVTQLRGSSQESAAALDPEISAVQSGLLAAGVLTEPVAATTVAPTEVLPRGAEVAEWIDHTLLRADATKEDILRLCEEARAHHFATICVNGSHIPTAARALAGTSVKPIAVVGFPLGAASTESKAFEAREAVRAGAQEIDMVIALGPLKAGDYATVLEDIRRVVEASDPAPVKVILETASLTREQKIAACLLSKAAGAAFVKTSTGFGAGGATVEDIALMRRVVGNGMGVKASGGVRTWADARRMIEAGANRIGASASVAILNEAKEEGRAEPEGRAPSPAGATPPAGY
jgi:deoxyribose-phosphate aldolase